MVLGDRSFSVSHPRGPGLFLGVTDDTEGYRDVEFGISQRDQKQMTPEKQVALER